MPSQQSHQPIDDTQVDELLDRAESFSFDCKRISKHLNSILETMVSFANSNGGLIAVGLEDPDKAVGRDRVFGLQESLENWDELQRLVQQRITEPDRLPLQFSEIGCTLRDGSKGSLGLVKVQKSERIHSIVGDGTFVRLEKGKKELTAAEINDLSFQRGTITAESQLVDVDFDVLETDYWRAYASHRRLTRPIREALQHLGLAKKDSHGVLYPLRAAVLLFAEEPSGVLASKSAIRVFHYRGTAASTDPNTNLATTPVTIHGPLVRQIPDARQAVIRELAKGVQVGPLGFEIVQQYPVRVITEAITNAVIHRDYRLPVDIQIRIFSDRIEMESPGLFAGPVTAGNIGRIGPHSRNPLIVQHLREFPDPPNLDAGEGVKMMRGTMYDAGLYPPIYSTRPRIEPEAVRVYLFNENRPSVWEQVSDFVDKHGSVANREVRQLMETDDTLSASQQLREWVDLGLLVVANPWAGKRIRRYRKPDGESGELFS